MRLIGELLAARPLSFTEPEKAARSRLRTVVATDAWCVSSLTDSAVSAAFLCRLNDVRFVATGLWLCLETTAVLLVSGNLPLGKLDRDPERALGVLVSGAESPPAAALAIRV